MILLLLPVTAFAVFSLPSDRTVMWQGNVGVDGGIPARVTEIDCTQAPYNVPTDGVSNCSTAINSCLSGISSGETAYLPAGTYICSSGVTVPSNKTLRGADRETTILSFTNTGQSSNITIGSGGYTDYTSVTSAPLSIISGYTKGSTTLVLADASSLSAGNHIYITETNDATIPVSIYGQDTCNYCGIFGAGGDRARLQIVEVVSVNTNTVIIDIPLYFTLSAGNTPMVNKTPGYTEFGGVEDLTISNAGSTKSSYRRGVRFGGSANCWVKNVRIENLGNRGVDMYFDNYRIEVRDSYITGCIDHANSDTCYGVHLSQASACLVENNIFDDTSNGVLLVSASGNVIAYNYTYGVHRTTNETSWMWPDTWTHGAHNTMNLWEGNNKTDIYYVYIKGSNYHNTAFWNIFTGKYHTIA